MQKGGLSLRQRPLVWIGGVVWMWAPTPNSPYVIPRVPAQRVSPSAPTPYFRFADPYLCSGLPVSLPQLTMQQVLASWVLCICTRAHACSHRGLAGAMRGGHAAPALGGFILSVGTGLLAQQSRSSSLPVPVAEGVATGRMAAWSIWVHVFPCTRNLAKPFPNPAVSRRPVPCARSWCPCSPARL